MSRYDSLVHSKDAMIRLLLGVLAILSLLLLVAPSAGAGRPITSACTIHRI